MLEFAVRYFDDECGATAIEYAMIAGGIALVILVAINAIGGLVLSDLASADIF